jgi:hypothetical protein
MGIANDVNLTGTGLVSAAGTGAFNYRTLTAGTNSTVTNGNGTAGNPTVAAGPWVFLSSATASSSSQLVFTGLSASYNSYAFVFDSIVLTQQSHLIYRVSTDGGSTYVSSANYVYYSFLLAEGGFSTDFGSGASEGYIIVSSQTAAGVVLNGQIQVINPYANQQTFWTGNLTATKSNTNTKSFVVAQCLQVTNQVNAVKFYTNGTGFTSGTVSMYGMCTPS